MRKCLVISVSILVLVVSSRYVINAQQHIAKKPASAGAESFIGAWVGAWKGSSTGTFNMTIAKDANGKLGGSILARQDNRDSSTAQFKSISADKNRLEAKFTDPGGSTVELVGTLKDGAIKGNYVIRRSDNSEVGNGTWTATKEKK